MKKRRIAGVCIALAAVVLAGTFAVSGNNTKDKNQVEIINVSYDPTREFYEEYNKIFADYWKGETGQSVDVIQSHGGSGKQALEISNGLPADVATLALEYDIDAIQNSGLIDNGWINEYPDDSAPYTSTIVFLVRKGNPKNIHDWDDLTKDGVGVITPNPKTSGGACWNYMAAWAYANEKYNGNEIEMKAFIKKLYKNVLVLDSGARGATTTFVENKKGDVLVAWENEAITIQNSYAGEYEIINPSVSILAQPSVAIVDDNADANGTQEVSRQYLEYLCSDEAQRLIGTYGYRPADAEILKEYADKFDLTIDLWSIDDFGGWDNAYETYFDDGALFDQIYNHS